MAVLPVKRGLSSPAVTSIPQTWDKQWFRNFIDAFLANADVRNVTAANGSGIVVSGNVSGNSTSGTPSNTVTISQAPIANNTVLGNVSGITAIPTALSQTQLTTLINIFTATLSGAAPASGGGTINFLRADGTWQVPAGSGAIPNNTVLGNVSGGTAAAVALTTTQLTTLINVFTSTLSGSVPASGGGTTNFLRADGNFAVPPTAIGANPTGLIGLTAVLGVATTFDRSDSTHAIDQSIVPTWTGIHTFSARPAFNLGATVSGGTFVSRGIADSALSNSITISSTQNVTLAAPTSGVTLSVVGNVAAIAANIVSGLPAAAGGADLRVARAGSTINTAAQGANLFLNDTTAVVGYYLQTSGGQFELWSSVGAGPVLTQIYKILVAGGLVWNAPTSGSAVTLAGAASAETLVVNNASAAGTSFGFRLNAGTNASDYSALVRNAGNTTNYFEVRGDGETFVAPNGTLLFTLAALTNNAGASAGTLTNAPAAGNPTKWIKINDNGTIRSIPAW